MRAFDLNNICEMPLFAGCFTVNESVKPVRVQSHNCEQMGFKRGTSEYASWRFDLARRLNPRGTTPSTTD
jgi:hypothetical protein